jgi:hypothetical protein
MNFRKMAALHVPEKKIVTKIKFRLYSPVRLL